MFRPPSPVTVAPWPTFAPASSLLTITLAVPETPAPAAAAAPTEYRPICLLASEVTFTSFAAFTLPSFRFAVDSPLK